jgi:preprotein translocase subunit SecE
MSTQEDIKREGKEGEEPEEPGEEAPSAATSDDGPTSDRSFSESDPADEANADAPAGAASPTQLGTRRFVYAAYFAGAIGIAFLMSKVVDLGWLRIQNWRPALGEPKDEVVMPVSALIGGLAALYYWRRTRARQLAEEVAAEMSKVTWPTRTEVTNGTFVVIVTTIISTVFFALMDKFWGFVTNLVYGGS